MKIWIHQFYSYSYQNVISDLQELHSNFIIPDINIIIANEVNVFDLEMRQKAIEIIYNLINTTTEVSEVFLHCNTIYCHFVRLTEKLNVVFNYLNDNSFF